MLPLLLVGFGFVGLLVGLGFYDWRLAAVVGGVLLMAVGLFADVEGRR